MRLKVTGQGIIVTQAERLVSGSEKLYHCYFDFSSEWNGFAKTAVFISPTEAREVPLEGNECVIPWEVLEIATRHAQLKIGVYGIKGDVRMPTVYTKPMNVELGAQVSPEGREPSPTQWEEILRLLADGSTWIDTTLTVPGKAADAAVVGADLTRLVLANSIDPADYDNKLARIDKNIIITASASAGWSDLPPSLVNAVIINRWQTANYCLQIAVSSGTGRIFTRITRPAAASEEDKIYRDWVEYARQSEINDLSDEVVKMVTQADISPEAYNNKTAKIDKNLITSISANNGWTDLPAGLSAMTLINQKQTDNYCLQIAVSSANGRMFTRITRPSGTDERLVYRDWVEYARMEDLNADIVRFVAGADYSAQIDSDRLSDINEGVLMLAQPAVWVDAPSKDASVIFASRRYSTNYNIQYAQNYKSGALEYRITDRRDGSVYKDWSPVQALETLNILAIGDSICRGMRNGYKGFVGYLGMPWKNKAVSGARLSNTRVPDEGDTHIYCIPDQLTAFAAEEAAKPAAERFVPDVIIADGDINDYNNSIALGTVPTAPVTTAEGAAALRRDTVMGGLEYLLYQMITLYPAAQRFFLVTHKTYTWRKATPRYAPDTRNGAGYTQTEMVNAIKAACAVYGVEVIDVFGRSMLNTAFPVYVSATHYDSTTKADAAANETDWTDADGVHPLPRGYIEGYVPFLREALRLGKHTADIEADDGGASDDDGTEDDDA